MAIRNTTYIYTKEKLRKLMRTLVVKGLFKKGEGNHIGNYRPLSLLFIGYKVLTKLVT